MGNTLAKTNLQGMNKLLILLLVLTPALSFSQGLEQDIKDYKLMHKLKSAGLYNSADTLLYNIIQRNNSDSMVAEATLSLAELCLKKGDFEGAEELFAEATRMGEKIGSPRLLSRIDFYLGAVQLYLENNLDSAFFLMKRGYRGDTTMKKHYYTNLATLYEYRGQYDSAVYFSDLALNEARRLNDTTSLARIYSNRSTLVAITKHEPSEPNDLMVLELSKGKDYLLALKSSLRLAKYYRKIGDIEKSERYYEQYQQINKEKAAHSHSLLAQYYRIQLRNEVISKQRRTITLMSVLLAISLAGTIFFYIGRRSALNRVDELEKNNKEQS